MKITQYEVRTGMGKGLHKEWEQIPFLTPEDIQTLNDIGYGTNKQFTRTEYLNQKYEGQYLFDIKQIEYDTGDFCESFNVIVVNCK